MGKNLLYRLDKNFNEEGIHRFIFNGNIDDVVKRANFVRFEKDESRGILDEYSINYDFELDGLSPRYAWVRRSDGLVPVIMLASKCFGEISKKRQLFSFNKSIESLGMEVAVYDYHYDKNLSESEIREILVRSHSNIKFKPIYIS